MGVDKTIKIGDWVAFNVNFLRSTAQEVGEMPFKKGRVVSVAYEDKSCRLLNIVWNDWSESTVNEANLTNNTLLDATIGAIYVGKRYEV